MEQDEDIKRAMGQTSNLTASLFCIGISLVAGWLANWLLASQTIGWLVAGLVLLGLSWLVHVGRY